MKHTSRLFYCIRCHIQVLICPHRDRGNIYCGNGCSREARIQSCRLAEKRYQLTPGGKMKHALRQRRRGNEKGRVERVIRYVRDNFFAAREYSSLDDLNSQASTWCDTHAQDRPCPEDREKSVRVVFQEEQPRLITLPDNPYELAAIDSDSALRRRIKYYIQPTLLIIWTLNKRLVLFQT